MTNSQIAKTNMIFTTVLSIFMAFLGVKSCNESSTWHQQQATNDKLFSIDSINAIQLIQLRLISEETEKSITMLTSINSKSQRQIDSLHAEINQLKAIYKAGQKQLVLTQKSFNRVTNDSISKDHSDSLIWNYTETQIERILAPVYYSGFRVLAPSFREDNHDKGNLTDTINILIGLLSTSTLDNLYLKKHPFVKQAALDYINFLARMSKQLTYDQASYPHIMLSVHETAIRWPDFMGMTGFHDTYNGWKRFESELVKAENAPQGYDQLLQKK